MLKLYDFLESGNGYKVRLLLHQLQRRFERVEIDILQGETRTPEFLALNPNGRIPTLQLEDGTCLAESNAIQWYLAEGTDFLPASAVARAQARPPLVQFMPPQDHPWSWERLPLPPRARGRFPPVRLNWGIKASGHVVEFDRVTEEVITEVTVTAAISHVIKLHDTIEIA